MPVRFCKYHALGNDYLVLADKDRSEDLNRDFVRWLCERHTGVGADGVLAPRDDGASMGVTIWNADGSRAEKSGNGLRIFARFLWDEGRVTDRHFRIATDGGEVQAEILPESDDVRMGMGILRLHGMGHGEHQPGHPLQAERLSLDGEDVECYLADIGNPHCVLLVANPTAELANRLGPQIEVHHRFPQRTNVQFVNVMDRGRICLEIWERGSGYTRSSGSSASAAVGVAHNLGLVDACVQAIMPGGILEVSVDADNSIAICGPAVKIADVFVEVSP